MSAITTEGGNQELERLQTLLPFYESVQALVNELCVVADELKKQPQKQYTSDEVGHIRTLMKSLFGRFISQKLGSAIGAQDEHEAKIRWREQLPFVVDEYANDFDNEYIPLTTPLASEALSILNRRYRERNQLEVATTDFPKTRDIVAVLRAKLMRDDMDLLLAHYEEQGISNPSRLTTVSQ